VPELPTLRPEPAELDGPDDRGHTFQGSHDEAETTDWAELPPPNRRPR
jgi:hypothetical protein